MLPRRLRRLPSRDIGSGLVVLEARGLRARLLGLALLRAGALPPGHALLILRCSSVHTFGMRFRLDLVFLDASGAVLRVERDVPPGRVITCRGADAVVELPAGGTNPGRPSALGGESLDDLELLDVDEILGPTSGALHLDQVVDGRH